MVNAQEWLDQIYPIENRKEITYLDISSKNLEDQLELTDFINLNYFDCSNNGLTSLNLKDCQRLEVIHCYCNRIRLLNLPKLNQLREFDASYNQLIDIDLSAFNPENLLILKLHTNNFNSQDIDCFSSFTKLEYLLFCNDVRERIEKNDYNRFYGSLKSLQNMNNLKYLDIRATDVEKGLEYLPTETKEFKYTSDWLRPEAKATNIFHEFLKDLSSIINPNNPYNFLELKQEITRLKYQELAPQVRNQKTGFEKLMVNLKEKAGEGSFAHIIDLLLTTHQQKEQATELSQKDKLSGKIEAYQEILVGGNLTKEELQIFLDQQTELSQLEEHLNSLAIKD
ncbi:7456_t:CDS:1 [Dentiscutata erythropus]|uniref:7456_t:CDS:1 n=1 Tax=Dentiscutata erythropus TaxID=1348616 RepID=A0A9N8Z9Q8_9GLOM|nr:7456_t:CDS:1 [Dentiscutata erythropus]